MNFRLEIDCNNAAFGDSNEEVLIAVGHILRALSDTLDNSEREGHLWDTNGNIIGGYLLRGAKGKADLRGIL